MRCGYYFPNNSQRLICYTKEKRCSCHEQIECRPKENDESIPSKTDTADIDKPEPQFEEALSTSLEGCQRNACKERACSPDKEEEQIRQFPDRFARTEYRAPEQVRPSKINQRESKKPHPMAELFRSIAQIAHTCHPKKNSSRT